MTFEALLVPEYSNAGEALFLPDWVDAPPVPVLSAATVTAVTATTATPRVTVTF